MVLYGECGDGLEELLEVMVFLGHGVLGPVGGETVNVGKEVFVFCLVVKGEED